MAGGSVQTPSGWSFVSRGLALTSDRAGEPEAGALDQRDRVVLAHVAALHLRCWSTVGAPAMIDDAEHAAGLQRLVEGAQRAVGLAALDPVVQVAESEHEVGAAGRRDVVPVGVELRDDDLAVQRSVRRLQPREQLAMVGQVARRRRFVSIRRDVQAAVAQPGREDLHVVAGAARQDLHDGARGLARRRTRALRAGGDARRARRWRACGGGRRRAAASRSRGAWAQPARANAQGEESARLIRSPARLPRPAPLQFHLQRHAEEGADEHDQAEHQHAVERRRHRHRADDVAGDEQLEAQEDAQPDVLAQAAIAVAGHAVEGEAHRGRSRCRSRSPARRCCRSPGRRSPRFP
jgi:hypothetical protein